MKRRNPAKGRGTGGNTPAMLAGCQFQTVTLDDSYQLKDLLDSAESTDTFLETLQKIRQEHIEQYQ